jgi:hypothetical protein
LGVPGVRHDPSTRLDIEIDELVILAVSRCGSRRNETCAGNGY